jgi:hypothetical protein
MMDSMAIDEATMNAVFLSKKLLFGESSSSHHPQIGIERQTQDILFVPLRS